ncbi:uncharacterized protein B0H18DRAFT_26989 [Fomitopsis serialis]|uniref:uncharacterized protein n=1 Tax=Fomitopsis serialis TaxID=139415 RepID=UPI0020072122|nr:uncharacterized protein B0H18DRAFT_26989 [Neoantrodia serialis]KAH9932493.1 hypothetical protein B0H18DRAFT_26989 [Neoantrodia serialis]
MSVQKICNLRTRQMSRVEVSRVHSELTLVEIAPQPRPLGVYHLIRAVRPARRNLIRRDFVGCTAIREREPCVNSQAASESSTSSRACSPDVDTSCLHLSGGGAAVIGRETACGRRDTRGSRSLRRMRVNIVDPRATLRNGSQRTGRGILGVPIGETERTGEQRGRRVTYQFAGNRYVVIPSVGLHCSDGGDVRLDVASAWPLT